MASSSATAAITREDLDRELAYVRENIDTKFGSVEHRLMSLESTLSTFSSKTDTRLESIQDQLTRQATNSRWFRWLAGVFFALLNTYFGLALKGII